VKTYQLGLLILILSSCGGGGSSGPENISPPETDNDNSLLNETCVDTSRSGMKRCDLKHDNLNRFYYIYTPNNLDTNQSIPVLFAFHGYGSSAMRHLSYTNYFLLADSGNFIVVYPQGATTATLSSHWNVGGWTSKSTIDDLDFIDTVIGLVKDKIQIDETRIYSSGMSNGGYMGYHLACNLSSKFAAIASVTGSMTNSTYDDCNPMHPTPILQIHGLLDFVVPYNGNAGSKSIPDVIDYWVNYNSCGEVPDKIIKYDNYSLISYETYINCLNNVNVKLILHPEMGHDWPSTQSYNVNASTEIWDFVSKYNIFGLIE
tara:strand:- start:15 stop:965 length:951 start_codon:yes stop_codon:yes gene_type:complete